MGIDRADDYDVAADRLVEHAVPAGGADRVDATDGRGAAETRDRFEYLDQLRAADTHQPARGEQRDTWDEAVQQFREKWAEHQERWPAEAREAVDRSADPPGSWRGESGRYLDRTANAEVEARCERIAEAERSTISPAMRAIEAADPTRELVGWEHRLKTPDRTKDKVATILEGHPGITASEAASDVPDGLRFTFCYSEAQYARGVSTDAERLKDHGFKFVEARNTWEHDLYKGINSRWRAPDSEIRIEVQFHTYTSYEAKQTAHAVYERVRDPRTTPTESHELRGLQRDLTKHTPIPPSALDVKVRDDAEDHLLCDSQRSLLAAGAFRGSTTP